MARPGADRVPDALVAGMADTVTIGSAENGKSLDVRVGSTIVVRLAENPTTGFRWELEPVDSAILEATGDTFEMGAEPKLGSGGTRQFQFAARSPGGATLALKLRQAWERDKPPLDTFSVDITVSP